MTTCEVCNKEHPNIQQRASRLGNFELRYCPACLKVQAEPYELLVRTMIYKQVHPNIVCASLIIAGKTIPQLRRDIREAERKLPNDN